MDTVGQELESSAAIEDSTATKATDMAEHHNDTQPALHHMRSSLDEFELGMRDLVTPRAVAFGGGDRLIWPQPSLEAGEPPGDVGDPGQNWHWNGGLPREFLAAYQGGGEEHQTELDIKRRHSIAGPDPNEYLLQSRYHSAPELPILNSLLAAPDLDIYTPEAAAQNPRRVGFSRVSVQQSSSPVLAASPGQIRTADVAADVAGSPGGARSGAGGRLRQGIIRTQSQDFTIDPETGRMLRFGPAMAVRANAVELPSVTALFADVSSRGLKRQRRWSPSTPRTPRTPIARKASTGKRRNNSPMSPADASEPDQAQDRNASADRDGHIWRIMCQQMLQLRAPASAHQLPRSPPLSPPLNPPADPPQHPPTDGHFQHQSCSQQRADWQKSTYKAELRTSQGEQSDALNEREDEGSQGLQDDTLQLLQGMLTMSRNGAVREPTRHAAQSDGRHLTNQEVVQQEGSPGKQRTRQHRRACQSAASGQSTFTQDRDPAEPKEGEASLSDSEDALGPLTRAPLGFGGITRSVIRAAEASGKHRAPVFRLEELHRAHSQQQLQQQQQQRFKGVSRGPWCLTWDAHVTSPAAGLRAQLGLAPLLPDQEPDKGGTEEPPIFLGTFLTQTSAAKAHDVATLKILRGIPAADSVEDVAPVACDTTADLNFPADDYHQVTA
ncbi:g1135 [Coccomyxa elongata]